MSAPAEPRQDSYQYDHARRKRAQRGQREKGCRVYIAVDELLAAGFSPDEPPPFYRCRGYQRSANASTVIVSLYREP